jgi:hypothetical protein
MQHTFIETLLCYAVLLLSWRMLLATSFEDLTHPHDLYDVGL